MQAHGRFSYSYAGVVSLNVFKKSLLILWLSSLTLILSGCQSLWVSEEKDSGPGRPMDVSHIKEPIPREELRTIAGNKTPYNVLGKTYHILKDPKGYRKKGVASWYGRKFHGRRTSNGEIYDMYGMTAAHKTLPIPSYVRVTNTDNNRSVIVRVNDRGPFHGNRVIDLSYTAAKKLGYQHRGTANVAVEYIDPATYHGVTSQSPASTVRGHGTKAPTPKNSAGYALPDNTYLQVGAFSKSKAAHGLKKKLAKMTKVPIKVKRPRAWKALYKVLVGPFDNNLQLLQFRQRLKDQNYPAPHVVHQ